MSYRPKGLGMDRELERKRDSKYESDSAIEVAEWIMSVLSEKEIETPPPVGYPEHITKESFQEWLKDGLILCDLMNTLTGSRVCNPKLTKSTFPAMQKNKDMEHVSMFLKAAEQYGVDDIDLFQTVSLYEGQNIPQVIATIYKLGSAAQANGYCGPELGVTLSQKNQRSFDEQKLREGRSIIGLQMGTNQVASQQGMTPYGLGRQLVYKSNS